MLSSVKMIGTSSACDRGTRRHLYRALYATRQKHRPYRSIVADMTPLIEALACSQFTTPWPGAKPSSSDEIIEQSVMSPAKAQAARGSRVLTGGRFGILGILFSLASACPRNADRLTSFPRRLFRLCVLAAGQLRGRSDLVARSCIRVGDFGVDPSSPVGGGLMTPSSCLPCGAVCSCVSVSAARA